MNVDWIFLSRERGAGPVLCNDEGVVLATSAEPLYRLIEVEEAAMRAILLDCKLVEFYSVTSIAIQHKLWNAVKIITTDFQDLFPLGILCGQAILYLCSHLLKSLLVISRYKILWLIVWPNMW